MTEAKLHKQLAALTQRPSDKELKQKLAELLPNQLETIHGEPAWRSTLARVRDTEWEHICYLIRVKLTLPISVGCDEPWQEQGREILSYLEAEATLKSNCCQSPMRVAVEGTTHWHECVKCGQACDPAMLND